MGSSPPVLCSNSSSLGSSTPTGAACAPGDYGRQALSPAEAEKRSVGKRKSDSSGKARQAPWAKKRGRGDVREDAPALARRQGGRYPSCPLWLPAARFHGAALGPGIRGHVFLSWAEREPAALKSAPSFKLVSPSGWRGKRTGDSVRNRLQSVTLPWARRGGEWTRGCSARWACVRAACRSLTSSLASFPALEWLDFSHR